MADKTVKQARQETAALRKGVTGMLQDRVYQGKAIPPGTHTKYPEVKKLGDPSNRENERQAIGGNPLHYHTHVANKGKIAIDPLKKGGFMDKKLFPKSGKQTRKA